MIGWLENDLKNVKFDIDWLIVFFHHPPYTKGGYNSDTNEKLTLVRQNILPILECYGVDLVLAGHSHVYERSFLINGQYGTSDKYIADPSTYTINGGSGRSDEADGAYQKPEGITANNGTVYIVLGSSGFASASLEDNGTNVLNHPVMYESLLDMVIGELSISSEKLDMHAINTKGHVVDYFSIEKN